MRVNFIIKINHYEHYFPFLAQVLFGFLTKAGVEKWDKLPMLNN